MMTLSPALVLLLCSVRRRLVLLLLCGAVCVIAFGAATAHAGVQEETHSFSHLEDGGLGWDTSYTTSFDVPLFDTLGGTRELVGFSVLYSRYPLAYETVIAPNTSGELLYDTVEWDIFWNLTNDATGDTVFPIPDFGDWEVVGGGRGAQRADGFAGEVIPAGDVNSLTPNELDIDYTTVSGGIYLDAYRKLFTGTGTLTLNSEIFMTMEHAPDDFFEGVYTPGFVTINPEAVRLDFEITYVYSSVPTPGAMALLGLAGIGLNRRRRRA